MLRLWFSPRRFYHRPRHLHLPRPFSSSSPRNPAEPSSNLGIPQNAPPPLPIVRPNPLVATSIAPESPSSSSSSSYLSPVSAVALSATAVSAVVAALYYAAPGEGDRSSSPLRHAADQAVTSANESLRRVYRHARQTGAAASVLWESLRSVLSSANHEVRVGFELRVASLLADIAAANASRRSALVGAGGGKVVDWLLQTVAAGGGGKDGRGTQAEAARALAYLIADPDVSPDVLGRRNAVPCLLRFIFSCQPKKKKQKHGRRSSFDVSDSLKGRSMLVAAIMDIVTANCDSIDKVSFQPLLPGVAETRDIAAAIEVIEEGGLHMDKPNDGEDDDDGGKGLKGLGIKILEGTTVLGLARTVGVAELEHSNTHDEEDSFSQSAKTLSLLQKHDTSHGQTNLSSPIVPGLWDDLHSQHVAVPFAAWALANWAMASEVNRSRIQELDQDGRAVMTALMAPERSVKWHGSLVARLLLEDRNLSLNDSVSEWSSSLLATISQASENEDISLARVALPAFLLSVERSPEARRILMDKGLPQMRETAKRTMKHKQVQEALAKALELVANGDTHLSLEEGQKWSSILLPWIFSKASTEKLRSSATTILSCILEDYGPTSVPISQGWLAMMLHEVLASIKASSVKGSTLPKTDKVKTQVDQSNIAFATQTSTQLAVAVVNLAVSELEKTIDSVVTFPLADLFSLEPFVGPFKNLKKDTIPSFDVADSALATLKGIKALTELCSDDASFQDKITEFGVICLLRRFLLCDDYETLAARKAYYASRALEAQERSPSTTGESNTELNDSSSVRVPPVAHIRKHAARLLTVLSGLPKVQKIILGDKILCKWLEDCADGKIPGCLDPKLQSYARAALLNASCYHHRVRDSSADNDPEGTSRKSACPHYHDVVHLIKTERLHWKHQENTVSDAVNQDGVSLSRAKSVGSDRSTGIGFSNFGNDDTDSGVGSDSDVPSIDVVFVHGLRGGPFKTWRLADDKSSTKSGFVEKIDEEAGKMGTFWPGEWLPDDFPEARLFTLKYKSNLTQWSGASLPLQEVSSKLLDKLVAAGIGNRPVVFVTHSMGGLVVKQMLYKAKEEKMENLVNNTAGIVFYSCPHFGSKLADMPWRMGLVLRPAPTIGELRSGSPRLVELNDFIRQLEKTGSLKVLNFCETKVTPIVEGYGGWAVRMEIVPIESAYPGYGDIVVLKSTDHINSCKPISRTDLSYAETLEFLRKLNAHYS